MQDSDLLFKFYLGRVEKSITDSAVPLADFMFLFNLE